MDDMVTSTVRIDREIDEWLENRATRNERSKAAEMRFILRERMRAEEAMEAA